MNLRDLEYVVAVAEHRHFGRAAEACGVSQPTLSAQVRKLEDELGVELFERSPRNIRPTAAGERVLERIKVVLRETRSIADIATEMSNPETSTLRIGLFPTLAPYLLPHVVPELRSTFPDLALRLIEAKTDDIVDRLRSGDLDAGVLALPVEGDDLMSQLLFSEDFLLAVPADHELAGSDDPVELDVLAGESVLLLEDGHCLRDQALLVCTLAGAVEDESLRSTSLETMRQMVAAGVGVTLLPRMAVSPPTAPSPMVALREFAAPAPGRTIAMFWRTSSAYRSFMPRLAEVFARVSDAYIHPL